MENKTLIEVISCGSSILFWVLLIISFHKDRSRYRNCYFLFAALVSGTIGLTFFFGEYQVLVIALLLAAVFILMLIIPVFLIWNGVLMIKREGRGLANLLSLILGVIFIVGEAAAFFAFMIPSVSQAGWKVDSALLGFGRVSMLLGVSVLYLSMSFVVFALYCVFLQLIPRKRDFDYVIIHGAGLLEGDRVSKLLADRIDKAIQIYRKDPTPPMLIPSGGKGSDERISEALAMEVYLLEKDIPPEKIIKEDRSATTFENLKFSKAIIDAQKGRKYTALVTSNYHVYRALRYCRKIGLKCVGVGSHVAFYYWPSALIREYVAVHTEKKRLIMLIVGWLLSIAPLIIYYFTR